jgi:oligoribonuclease
MEGIMAGQSDFKITTIIWIDCEMTGLDNEDELIEIAVIPTDMQLNVLDEGVDYIIKPTENGLQRLKDNEYVYKMHQNSGLLDELENGEELEAVKNKVLDYLKQFADKYHAMLGGNSVYVDRRFLDLYMPEVSKYLHYRLIDVSTIKELGKVWYPEVEGEKPEKESTHRALDDIIESIDELKFYREKMFR